MNRYIEKPDVASFLQRAKKNISGKPSYICPNPICENGSGRDGTGIVEDPDRPGHYHCFKCDFDGDAFDLLDIVNGKAKGYSYKEAEKMAGFPPPLSHEKKSPQRQEQQRQPVKQYDDYINACVAAMPLSEGAKYLHSRGISDSTIERYKLGYDQQRKAVIIPYPGTGYYIRPRAFHLPDDRGASGWEYRRRVGRGQRFDLLVHASVRPRPIGAGGGPGTDTSGHPDGREGQARNPHRRGQRKQLPSFRVDPAP